MNKKKYKTTHWTKRKYYIAFNGESIVCGVFGTFKSACASIDISYSTARKIKPLDRVWRFKSKYIIEVGYIGGDYKGGKFNKSKDIEQTRMSNWRNDISYDEL